MQQFPCTFLEAADLNTAWKAAWEAAWKAAWKAWAGECCVYYVFSCGICNLFTSSGLS